jgi:hypothetical protein
MTSQYSCDSCMTSFDSIKDLVKHYREEHPGLIERVTIPI